ncbi:cystatin-12-like [Lepus europaeus]|uniref:cystatin-12-like n=1 Tax=Lepus europaeus TaxID=9983 RepID=UPI002B49686D|nr:cystatin-12-like [Lepus europaeus]
MLWRALLLVGLFLLGSQVSSSRFVDINKNEEFFAISVEHALYQFNESQEDEFAYKFMRIRRSKRKKYSWIYLVDLELGRTICKKHDEDIDNCPLQEGPGEKTVRCTYIIHSLAWITKFTVLDSTCVQTSAGGMPVTSPSKSPVSSPISSTRDQAQNK